MKERNGDWVSRREAVLSGVIWPLQDIRFVRGLCTRIDTITPKHPPCLGTPLHPFIAHTIAQ